MKKFLSALIVLVFALNACAPATSKPNINKPNIDEPVTNEPVIITETATPQVDKSTPAPTPTDMDSNLPRGNVYLDSAELLTQESFPAQFALLLKGNLPTPCDQLHVDISPPDSDNKIIADVYSVAQPDAICAQVLQPIEENFPLGSFPPGHYTLWVNGHLVAEFDA